MGGPDGGFVVLGRLTEQSDSLLAHELVHAFLRAGGEGWPWWVEEGLAGVLSNGPQRVRSSVAGPLLDARCAGEPESGMRASCYSLATRHVAWLLGDPQRRISFLDWMASRGRPSSLVAPAASWSAALEEESTPPPHAVQAELLARLGRIDEALAELDAAPAGRETLRSVGLAAAARGRTEQGIELLRRSYSLGDRDPSLLRELAFHEQAASPSRFIVYMEDLLESAPDDDASRLVLASHYLFQGRTDDARSHLASIRHVAPGQRDYFRRAMAAAGLPPSAAPALADD